MKYGAGDYQHLVPYGFSEIEIFLLSKITVISKRKELKNDTGRVKRNV